MPIQYGTVNDTSVIGQVLPFPDQNTREVIESAIITAQNTGSPLVYEAMKRIISEVFQKTGLRRWPFGNVVAVIDRGNVRIMARGA